MRVLLVEPPFYLFQTIKSCASLGLAMLAAVARRAGHEVRVYSPDLLHCVKNEQEQVISERRDEGQRMRAVIQKVNDIVDEFQPHVVGFSLWTARVNSGLQMARAIKERHPAMVTLAGGIHVNIRPGEVLKSGVIDYAIRGEGEDSFVAFLRAIEEGRPPINDKIAGLTFLDANGTLIQNPVSYIQNLDELPFPAYDLFIDHEKMDRNAFGSIMFSRGCPFDCTFCASWKIWTRKVRFHSASYMVSEIEHIKQTMGTTYLRFDDDTFTLKRQPVEEICKLMIERNLGIEWHCDTRVEFVTHDLLKLMKDAGLRMVAMGIESGDMEMRKKIKKVSKLDAVRKAFKITRESGVKTTGYFMMGFPGETFEQAQRTLDLVEEVQPDEPCISICIPYPGTETYELALATGVIKDENAIDWSNFYHHANMNFSGAMSEQEWKMLLVRSSKITKTARRRAFARKAVTRYRKNPLLVFNDAFRLIRRLQKSAFV